MTLALQDDHISLIQKPAVSAGSTATDKMDLTSKHGIFLVIIP